MGAMPSLTPALSFCRISTHSCRSCDREHMSLSSARQDRLLLKHGGRCRCNVVRNSWGAAQSLELMEDSGTLLSHFSHRCSLCSRIFWQEHPSMPMEILRHWTSKSHAQPVCPFQSVQTVACMVAMTAGRGTNNTLRRLSTMLACWPVKHMCSAGGSCSALRCQPRCDMRSFSA